MSDSDWFIVKCSVKAPLVSSSHLTQHFSSVLFFWQHAYCLLITCRTNVCIGRVQGHVSARRRALLFFSLTISSPCLPSLSASFLRVRIESWRKFFVHGCYCGPSLLVCRWIMDEASVMFKRTAIIVTRFQKAAVWVYFCLVFFFFFFVVDLILRWLSLLCFTKWRIKSGRCAQRSEPIYLTCNAFINPAATKCFFFFCPQKVFN